MRKLLPGGLLDDARAADVAKAYNAQEGVVVQVLEQKFYCVSCYAICRCFDLPLLPWKLL